MSVRSSTLNASSAAASRNPLHGTSSTASLARPRSASSNTNPTFSSNFSLFPNSNNISSQQQRSTTLPNSDNISNEQQRPIRWPFHYPNVYPQKPTKGSSSDPIKFTEHHQALVYFSSNPSTAQTFNVPAQQHTTALTSSHSITPNEPPGSWSRQILKSSMEEKQKTLQINPHSAEEDIKSLEDAAVSEKINEMKQELMKEMCEVIAEQVKTTLMAILQNTPPPPPRS